MLMVMSRQRPNASLAGFTLLEVLITLVLLAFSLTALVSMQMKLHMTEMESYQRGQAIVLVQDMTDRIISAGLPDDITEPYTNPYVTGVAAPLGVGDTQDSDDDGCQDEAAGVARDLCEWSLLLKGASELTSGGGTAADLSDDERSGGMIGARGCVEEIQAPDDTPGTCDPGIYRVTVVWQGMHATAASGLTCGQALNAYGSDDLRRAISSVVSIGLTDCQ